MYTEDNNVASREKNFLRKPHTGEISSSPHSIVTSDSSSEPETTIPRVSESKPIRAVGAVRSILTSSRFVSSVFPAWSVER